MLFAAMSLGAALVSGSAPTVARPRGPVPTPQFRTYGVDDGLPSTETYALAQDRQGYIWVGTRDGLARFDGQQFRVFRHRPDDPSSLPANFVTGLLVGRDGHLWVGGESAGLNLYQPKTGGFRHWLHDPDDPHSIAGNDVDSIAQTPDGSIWAAIDQVGLDRLVPGTDRFEHLVHRDGDAHSIASNWVLALRADARGNLWIGSAVGLDVRRADGRIEHVHFPGHGRNDVWRIDVQNGQVRVATARGLFVVDHDLTAHRVAPGALPGQLVTSSLRADDGSLWVTSRNGIFRVDTADHAEHFTGHPLLPGGLGGHFFWQVIADREGGLWFASRDGGLSYLAPTWRDFTHFRHVPDAPQSLTHSHVIALAEDQGCLLVGGANGQLDRLDPDTGKVVHLGPRLGLNGERVVAAAATPSGLIWVGYNTGAALIDPVTGERKVTVKTPYMVTGIITDGDRGAYLQSDFQGVSYVTAAGKRTPLISANAGPDGSTALQMSLIDGHLWRATRAGLSQLTADGKRFQFVPGVSRGRIDAFDVRGDQLWLVSTQHLMMYRREAGGRWSLQRDVVAGDGWSGTRVHALVADRYGHVWLASEDGLWRYDVASGHFRVYGVHDGLPGSEFTSKDVVIGAHGTVYMGTIGGVVGFRPGQMSDRVFPPTLVLESVQVRRHGEDVSLVAKQGHRTVRWDDRDLRIRVQALSYVNPSAVHYRFRLKGFDTRWVDTGAHNVRQFAALSAGHYELQVEAAGADGHWAALAVPVRFDVAAPPWLRPWAFVAYALAIAGLIWLVLVLWKRRIEQRHRILLAEQRHQLAEERRELAEQASAAKTGFLATLGHEIRTPMTGVLGMAELLAHAPIGERERRFAEAIQRSGSVLLKLVNDALDLARIEARRLQLEPEVIDPVAVTREVVDLQSGLAVSKGLTMQLHAADGLPARVVGDGRRLRQILQNLINNAVKFTERGRVDVRLSCAPEGLHFTVEDTGQGIAQSSRERLFQRYEQGDTPQRQAGSGLGLAICRELVALMQGRIELESVPGQGSRFDVWLPLPEAAPEVAPARMDDTPMPNLSILLVEDDATVAEVVTGLLEAQGHHVTHAGDGLAALSTWQAGHFDVALMDLDLPGIDGFRVTQMIRAQEGQAHMPVIAITARSGGDEQARAMDAGMDAFLRKPVSGEQLDSVLRQVLCTSRC
ncbi:hybrid sensor histidine kinase/response regulator [Oleiagrimonas sp. C23AA]|uniref:hybrid sensor histidine kinase/response regulator n=1 Tax=Oleiagrimonas sp. C23AA TaxID=2719047 RepID=UPI001420070E|nr:hybrid sensor histidine kinase/response regulator [Oleiagrimonas sp. C23AA]NII12082.1 response regulator [Oleiagrimonas sp. C23AA]